MRKKILIAFMFIVTLMHLVGCGNKDREDVKLKDVIIRPSTFTHYQEDKNGKAHVCDDAILVCGFNGYECVDAKIEYDEETGKYTCTIEFKRIIE